MLAYLDVYRALMVYTLCAIPVIFLLKAPPKGGAAAAA